jgi:hypothetical protein
MFGKAWELAKGSVTSFINDGRRLAMSATGMVKLMQPGYVKA